MVSRQLIWVIMANTINWAEIYCSTWWGNQSNENTLHIDSQPTCFE